MTQFSSAFATSQRTAARRTSCVVGLFPAFDAGSYGGVQLSGRDAWQGIVDLVGEDRARAVYYEERGSKAATVLRALSGRRAADVILVWHLDLLKLLPVLGRASARVAVFLHGIEAWRKLDPVTRFLLRRTDLLLSNSDHTWSRFVECNPGLGTAAHLRVHLGCGVPRPGALPMPGSEPAVLMLGRLDSREDYKGHREILQAWPQVLERVPDAQLWIAGDGDLRAHLERLAAARVPNGSVRFWGRVPDVQKEWLIEQSRCVAMPSRAEGFGLVYLEAMRVGRPCLVSNLDAGREVVSPPHCGIAVDPDDTRALADAMSRLIRPGTEWDSWSCGARARYEGQFTVECFQRRLANALFDQPGPEPLGITHGANGAT